MGLGDPRPTWHHRYGAVAVCSVLIVGTFLAARFGQRPGPSIIPLIPITATIWFLADVLTAVLLLAQFYVNGRISFAVLTVGYASSGLLTCPYLIAFPGLFLPPAATPGQQSISLCFWIAWHCIFPTCVIISALNDSTVSRIVSRRAIKLWTIGIFVLPLLATSLFAGVIFTKADALPQLIIGGFFQPVYNHYVIPLVIGVNALGCLVLLVRRSRLTTLQLWLGAAMFAAGSDTLLQFDSMRYSYAWDAGKLVTVFTASVVLVMILSEVVGLYGRLAKAARIDPLTSLPNRRALEDHLQVVFYNAQRLHSSFAMLVVDIDFFKHYNDSYGHSAGDECLRAVARELAKSATRPLDLIARYGGEEFVAVLPNTPLQGVFIVAEQIRSLVEALEIVLESRQRARVTVSVGIGFASNAAEVSASGVFEAADRGLYEAKSAGRNRMVLGTTLPEANLEPAETKPPALAAVVNNVVTVRPEPSSAK